MSFTYKRMAIYKFFTVLLLISHWLSCLWAMTLVLVDEEEDGVRIPRWVDAFDELEQNVAVKTRDAGWKLYTASLYFTSYTITSVGYGDIGPLNIVERVVCIAMIVTAGVSWACVLGQVSGILGNMDKRGQEFRDVMDDLNSMMVDRHLPADMCRRIRSFFLSTKGANWHRQQQDLLQMMSPALQGEVAMTINSKWIKRVGFLRDFVERAEALQEAEKNICSVDMPCKFRSFVVRIALSLRSEHYAQLERFGKHQTLYIIQRGLAISSSAPGGQVLNQGSVSGEDFVLSCAGLQKPIVSLALTHLEAFVLGREGFMEIVQSSDSEEIQQAVRKHVVRLAVARGFVLEARRRSRAVSKKSVRSAPSRGGDGR